MNYSSMGTSTIGSFSEWLCLDFLRSFLSDLVRGLGTTLTLMSSLIGSFFSGKKGDLMYSGKLSICELVWSLFVAPTALQRSALFDESDTLPTTGGLRDGTTSSCSSLLLDDARSVLVGSDWPIRLSESPIIIPTKTKPH